MNLYLIGFRCTGKTTVGKTLSKTMGWPFVDLDVEVVKNQGVTIKTIVKDQGWDAFREMERTKLQNICVLDRRVVATGGGVILDPKNVKAMRQSGILIWLKATPETIRKRMGNDKDTEAQRPALTSKGVQEEIDYILEKRNPLYEKAMSFSVSVDDHSVGELCKIIITKLKEGNYADV